MKYIKSISKKISQLEFYSSTLTCLLKSNTKNRKEEIGFKRKFHATPGEKLAN